MFNLQDVFISFPDNLESYGKTINFIIIINGEQVVYTRLSESEAKTLKVM